jgi:hypothetical protein
MSSGSKNALSSGCTVTTPACDLPLIGDSVDHECSTYLPPIVIHLFEYDWQYIQLFCLLLKVL